LSNKAKAILVILAGLILVAVGVFASYYLIQRYRATQLPEVVEEETITTTIVVLTRDLSLGDRIEQSDVTLSVVPIEVVPRNALDNMEDAVGKIVKTDLIQGEMVLLHNLADPTNNNKDLSFILAEDHVLLAFPADDLMSRESMIQRGDIVDIFATFTKEVETVGETTTTTEEEEEPETRTFTLDSLQKLSVTALVLEVIGEQAEAQPAPLQGETNQPAPEPETRIRAYLFALDPQDALLLKHLKDTGAIFDFVLRAPTSTIELDLTPVTEEYIVEFYGLEILP
jgi:pilus assembly protein CpaB